MCTKSRDMLVMKHIENVKRCLPYLAVENDILLTSL